MFRDQHYKSSSESRTTSLASSTVSASFSDHLETCYVTYTASQTTSALQKKPPSLTVCYGNNNQLTSHRYWSTTLYLGHFVPPIQDCSLYLVPELLLVRDVFHLLLQLFGTIYQLMFALLKPSELFIPD